MKRYFVLLALFGAASNGFAGQLAKKGSWVLNEHGSGQEAICEASTSDSGFSRTYTLILHKTKNSTKPLEIFLHEKGKANYGPIAMASINNEVALFSEYSSEDKSRFFWYLPDETKQVLDLLRSSNKNLEVLPYGDSKGSKLKFSLRGAVDILASMEKLCNNGKPLVEERFSRLTDHSVSFDQNPKIFDSNTLMAIRASYYELAAHFSKVLSEEDALKKLEAANAPSINERRQLLVERANLSGKKIPELNRDISDTRGRIEQGERRLAQLKSEIPNAEKQRSTAQARFDDAAKKIAPHEPKHDALVADIRRAQSSLSNALGDKSSAENEVVSNTNKISQLDREAQSLSYTIQQLRSEISSAQSRVDRARREYNAYNEEYEFRRQLQASSRYHSLKRDADNIRRQLNSERAELVKFERDLSRAKSQLQQCQAKPIPKEGSQPLKPPGGLSIQSSSGNCDSLASQVRDLENRVRSKERDISRLDSQYSSAQREMDRIESDIRNDVRRVADRLRRAYDDAVSHLNQLNSRIAQSERERDDIMNYQIPRLRNRNDDLRRRISDLDRQIPMLRQEVARTEAELRKFDQSVGYAKLQQNLDTAREQLVSAKTLLERLIVEESQLNAQVPTDKARLVRLIDELKASEARLTQVIQRVAQLDKHLASFDSAKAEIDAKISGINGQIQSAQQRYMRYFL